MKLKTLLSLIALGYGTLVQGQFGPGLFTGGNAGLTINTSKSESGSTTLDGPTVTTVNIRPSIGYFFNEKIAAGLRLGFSQESSTKDIGSIESKTSSTGLGVELFGRYASPIGGSDNFAFLAEVNAGYNSTTGTQKTGSVSVDMDPMRSITFGIQPGIMFFPSPKYGVEASLGNIFRLSSDTTEDASNSSNTMTTTNMSILDFSTMGLDVGFYYYFSR